MSQTFYIVCHETKKRIWIGQGGGNMKTLYSNDPGVMAALKLFLNDHIGKELHFICCSTDGQTLSYTRYE